MIIVGVIVAVAHKHALWSRPDEYMSNQGVNPNLPAFLLAPQADLLISSATTLNGENTPALSVDRVDATGGTDEIARPTGHFLCIGRGPRFIVRGAWGKQPLQWISGPVHHAIASITSSMAERTASLLAPESTTERSFSRIAFVSVWAGRMRSWPSGEISAANIPISR